MYIGKTERDLFNRPPCKILIGLAILTVGLCYMDTAVIINCFPNLIFYYIPRRRKCNEVNLTEHVPVIIAVSVLPKIINIWPHLFELYKNLAGVSF